MIHDNNAPGGLFMDPATVDDHPPEIQKYENPRVREPKGPLDLKVHRGLKKPGPEDDVIRR